MFTSTTARRTARRTSLATAGALLATPAVLLVAGPAQADTERSGACASGRYELSVDREGRGYEVNVDLDDVAPGSRWKVVLRQDGKRFVNTTLRADRDGDLDVERYRPNTSGTDTFKFRASRVDGPGACSARLTVR